MHVGYGLTAQNLGSPDNDRAEFEAELHLAALAEPLGFESVWTPEHHFNGYGLICNPLQFMTYMAGRTTKAELGSMVMVLPWHDPLRVIEELVTLDHMTDGRSIFGIGRGIAQLEFDAFRVNMGEARGRFVEAAQLVVRAMETGIAEFDGEYIKQPRIEIRPKPLRSLKGRLYSAAVSPESSKLVAKIGAGLLVIPQRRWRETLAQMAEYREIFLQEHGFEAPQPVHVGWVYCDSNEERARERATQYMGRYYASALNHYGLRGKHFDTTRGYEYYAQMSGKLEDRTEADLTQMYTDLHIWGTPEQCYEKIVGLQQRLGSSRFIGVFRYGDMPAPMAEESMRSFAREVIPALRKYQANPLPRMNAVA